MGGPARRDDCMCRTSDREVARGFSQRMWRLRGRMARRILTGSQYSVSKLRAVVNCQVGTSA
jgi:plastocyanin domain-containing protein